jgi:hypothetical protein
MLDASFDLRRTAGERAAPANVMFGSQYPQDGAYVAPQPCCIISQADTPVCIQRPLRVMSAQFEQCDEAHGICETKIDGSPLPSHPMRTVS